MKKMSRLALLVVALFATTWLLPAPEAQAAGGNCRIWCDNGITVEGWSSSFAECQQSFAANCSQWGWYGGMFCYSGEEGSGCWFW
jgi:hypothetical protein